MNPKENLEQNQWFPRLELLPEFQEITSLTKDAITVATNDEKPKESPVNFKDFELDWSNWEAEETEEQKAQRELEFKVNNKIIEIFEKNEFFKDKYNKIISRYVDNSLLLKIIFINISAIQDSNLESKDRFVRDIFLYLETENLPWYKDYLDKLFWNRENRENRTGFPKEIYTSMFALKDLFEKIFIQKIDTPVEANKDIWTQVWGWRIR